MLSPVVAPKVQLTAQQPIGQSKKKNISKKIGVIELPTPL